MIDATVTVVSSPIPPSSEIALQYIHNSINFVDLHYFFYLFLMNSWFIIPINTSLETKPTSPKLCI